MDKDRRSIPSLKDTLYCKKRVVWFCGLPEKARIEIFSDLDIPPGPSWSWVAGHMPPPEHIDLHIICGIRRIESSVSRKWNGATFHLVPVPRGGPYLLYEGWVPALVKKSEELSPDIVHGWGTECAFGLAALRALPRHSVIEIQGILVVFLPYLKKSIPRLLCVLNELRVLRRAKRCLAESHYSRNAVSKYTKAQIDVIPHPLREEFCVAPLGSRYEKTIIFLGTLYHRKGFQDAMRAFLDSTCDWKLVCVGHAPTTQEQKAIKQWIEEYGETRIELLGSQSCSQIIDWFQRCPLFLLPSYADTGPTALKEALAMGLWPVCYDNTGPKELIGRYKVGSLSQTGNVEELGNTLKRLIDEQPWRDVDRMDGVARQIRSDLSPSTVWKKLEEVYNEII